ncbi:MAG: AI-2E family transporter [Alphaproteobacteria bacterium]|nr:AI-2E family transporter [Alphaproteobacteria bacterium]
MSGRAWRGLFWLIVIVLVLIALALLQSILLPFIAGIIIAFILAPAVARLERFGIRRSLASFAVLVLFLVGIALVFVLLVPLIQNQIVTLIGKLPALIAFAQKQFGQAIELLQQRLPADQVDKLRDMVGAKIGEALTWIASLFQGVITSSFAILNIVSLVIVTPIVTFFLLRDWDKIVAQIDANLPRQTLMTVRAQARLVRDTLVGFVHGQALVCLILALYYGTTLSFAGLESGLALGLLIGVLAIIPILGGATGFVLALGLAASQYGTWREVIIVCIIFAVGQGVESNFLTPKLVGDRINLHPVWVLFALFAGGTLFGLVGIVFAVPAAAVIGVLVRFALLRYRRSVVYDPRQPQVVRGLTPYR